MSVQQVPNSRGVSQSRGPVSTPPSVHGLCSNLLADRARGIISLSWTACPKYLAVHPVKTQSARESGLWIVAEALSQSSNSHQGPMTVVLGACLTLDSRTQLRVASPPISVLGNILPLPLFARPFERFWASIRIDW